MHFLRVSPPCAHAVCRVSQTELRLAKEHEEGVTSRIDRFREVDRAEDIQIEELQRNNRELQNEIRKLEKDKFVKTQMLSTQNARSREVEEQSQRREEMAVENMSMLQSMGYKVQSLEGVQDMVTVKEDHLQVIEEIADMMDDALNLMESAVETAKLEKEVVTQAGAMAADAVAIAAREFERSPQMRLWRASGLASCAVYQATVLGRERGKEYVGADQTAQANHDIIERLVEAEVVKQKLADRCVHFCCCGVPRCTSAICSSTPRAPSVCRR